MENILIDDIIKAVNGKLISGNYTNHIVNSISIDTRTIKSGDLFIPIKGDKFDGHNFIETAFKKGALCSLSEKEIQTNNIVIKVNDTRKALADLAMYYLSLFNIPVVAVTGSVGKTTTKDIIASVLSQKYNVVKTEGNFNNEIGLPLTIFNINKNTEAAVLEMGMNNFNEIHNLSRIAKPNIAVITNIGVSHIENLGSRDGILKAKCEIFDFMGDEDIKILNGDDDKLITLKNNLKNVSFFGIENDKFEFYAKDIDKDGIKGIKCKIVCKGKEFDVNIPLPGIHMVSNALAGAAVGSYLNLNTNQIKKGIENFKPTKMRMDIIKTEKYIIINDVYNANPVSIMSSIDVLSSAENRKVCILGDMLELGNFAHKLHKQVGEYAAKKNIDVIICIGELSKNMFDGANSNKKENQQIFYFKKQEEFINVMNEILKDNDIILVKASRGMNFEITTEKLQGE